MATFQITGPDGKKYRIKGENAEGAFKALQQHIGSAQAPAAESQPSQDLRGELSSITQGMDGELPGGNLEAARYEAMPEWRKGLVAATDIADLLANGASLGFGNKMAAGLRAPFTDKTYSEELEAMRGATEGARQRAGSAATAAELTGAIAAPVAAANTGITLAGRFGTGAMQGAKGLLARTGLMGVEGAGYGALTAAGNDEDITQGAGYGAVGGSLGNVAGEAISAGVGKVAGAFNKKPNIPSLDELRSLKDAAYDQAERAGVVFTPQGVDRLKSEISAEFANRGFLPANEPGAAAVLGEIDKLAGQNVTMKGLDSVRKMAGNAFIPGNNSNNSLTGVITSKIDDLLANPGSNDVLVGNSTAGSEAYKEARDYASRLFKAEKVQKAVDSADLRAASTGSGGNVDNATRQNLRRILEKERGLKPDEKAALEAVVRGTPTQNALRLAGKLSPSGNGLMAALGVGGAMVNPAIGALSLGGMGAKAAADSMTGKNVAKLAEILRAGGNVSATQAAPNAVQRLAQSKREALARILMGIGANEAGTP